MKKQSNIFCYQSGVALITSLIMLTILTLLAMAAMNTSTLDEKMAINMQQDFSSFHAAESGYNQTFDLPNSIRPDEEVTLQIILPNETVVDIKTSHRTDGPPPEGSGYSATAGMHAAYFDVHSTANVSKSQSSVRGGMYQMAPGGYRN